MNRIWKLIARAYGWEASACVEDGREVVWNPNYTGASFFYGDNGGWKSAALYSIAGKR